MLLKYGLYGIALGMAAIAHAQTVNVRGKVTDASGKPVANAVVELLRAKLKDTTGADGAYSLDATASAARPSGSRSGQALLERGVLELSVAQAAPIRIEIFDVKGNLVDQMALEKASAGTYRLDLAGRIRSERLLIVKASVGHVTKAFPYYAQAHAGRADASPEFAAAPAGSLAKVSAAVDTLQVAAAGYAAKKVEVASYDLALDVALAVSSGDRWGGLRNPPARSAGCGRPLSTFKTGTNTYNMASAGLNRRYISMLPANYDPNKPYRLVFGMHWMGGSDDAVQGWSQWFGLKPLDNEAATIYVAPNGYGNPPMWNQGAKDHTYFEDLVKHFESSLCIDESRIFSLGFSFGAMFSNSLAQTHQDILRGIVVYAAADVNIYFPANTGKPMAYMGVHGISDPTCTIQMGRSSINRFVKNNGCTVPAMVPEAKRGGSYVKYDYTCPSSYPVRWVTFDGKHTYPPNDNGTWVHPMAWEFITQF